MNPKLIPNTCQVPNLILDEVMPKVSHAEFKIIMAVVRKTYGWHKQKDRISISQLVKMTGVSNRKVIDCTRNLGWIINSHKLRNGTTEYSINLSFKSAVSSRSTSEASSQISVNSVHRGYELTSHTKDTNQKTLSKEDLMSEWDSDDSPSPADNSSDSEPEANRRVTVKEFVESWNEEFNGQLPAVHLPLSKDRTKKLLARLKEHPFCDFWETVFGNIDSSKFLLGTSENKDGHESWRCTFDFLIKNETNCIKIFEGVYNHGR